MNRYFWNGLFVFTNSAYNSIENPLFTDTSKGGVILIPPLSWLNLAPKLGDILVPELIKEIGSPDKILAYGKAGVVGLDGEIEHASAFIHTLRFGNKFRDAVGGTSYLSFTNTRGTAGSKISIPMMHKTDSGLRPYYLTHEFTIHDAPFNDEVVIAIGGASSGRAHARTGDRYQDMKEMGIEPK